MLRCKLVDEDSIAQTAGTIDLLIDFVKEVHSIAAAVKVP